MENLTDEQLKSVLEKMLWYYNKTIQAVNLAHLPQKERENYTDPYDYITDLRARLTYPAFLVNERIAAYGQEAGYLKYKVAETQARKQLEYQEHAQTKEGGGYSKSQSETIGRKRTEIDEEYKSIKRELVDAEVKLEDFRNLKWLIQQASNTMSAFSPKNNEL